MKRVMLAAAAAIATYPLTSLAQSPFDGTWKTDAASFQFGGKPFELVLLNGKYNCISCAPPYTVAADGADHAISGNPYINSVAITVVSDHEISETDKKGGKTVAQKDRHHLPGRKIGDREIHRQQ